MCLPPRCRHNPLTKRKEVEPSKREEVKHTNRAFSKEVTHLKQCLSVVNISFGGYIVNGILYIRKSKIKNSAPFLFMYNSFTVMVEHPKVDLAHT